VKENGMRGTVISSAVVALVLLGCGGGAQRAEVASAPMPDGGNWTGVYFSPQYGEMHMVQNGSAVHGRFKKDERTGTIQGEADGNVLQFEWTENKAMVSNRPQETKGSGYFQYLVDSASGDHVLKGRWGLGDDNTSGGEWNAYRSRNREPDPDSLSDEGSSGGESIDDDESSDDGLGGGESDDDEGDDIF
jgi:hypothetical protein